MEMEKQLVIPDKGVIFGHQAIQTRDAKWLCVENVFQKCYRPNMYDIGGTYIEDIPHYWFYYKIEIVGNIFLFHLFVSSRREGTFEVSVSCGSEIAFKRKQCLGYLTSSLKTYKIDNAPEMSQNYLTTYSFSEIDVEILKGMKLYIPVSFNKVDSYYNSTVDTDKEHNFRALLDDPYGSDFIIESGDGEKFKVHKILLSAHSDVFKAMLKENTAESQNSYMKMVDVNTEDLKGLIEFIYTGTIKDMDSNFFNLLKLGDQYNLQGLRELSEFALAAQLNLENVIETLAVADVYNADNLKLAAFKFIKCNHIAIHDSLFEELDSVKLIRELCKFLVPN